MQPLKERNNQLSFNQSIKNEDSIYKLIAYTGALEKKRREDRDATRANVELAQGGHTFEQFY